MMFSMPKIPCGNSVTKNSTKTANNILVVRSVCRSLSKTLLDRLDFLKFKILASSESPFPVDSWILEILLFPINIFLLRLASNKAPINRRLKNVSAIQGTNLIRTGRECFFRFSFYCNKALLEKQGRRKFKKSKSTLLFFHSFPIFFPLVTLDFSDSIIVANFSWEFEFPAKK